MLKYLYIKDFILFDEVTLDLEDGFSVFTGETGAGKSIMVDAIELLCAQRANAKVVAKGKDSAIIEGVFDFSKSFNIQKILEEYGFDIAEDTVITRIIKADGKSVARINHRMVNLNIVKEIMDMCVDIHSQHDTQYLLKAGNHINLLDNYQVNNNLLDKVKEAYNSYISIKKEMDKALSDDYNIDDLDFYKYEINEIENAELKVGEDDELAAKENNFLAISKNLNKINTAIGIYDGGLQDDLFEIGKLLSGSNDEKLTEISDIVNNSYYEIDDAIERLKSFVSRFEISEEDINQVQARIFEINRLKRKYGNSIELILKYKENLDKKIDVINNREEYLSKMEIKLNKAHSQYLSVAKELSSQRMEAALKLDAEIMSNLHDLMLPNAKFKTEISSNVETKLGIDKVEFLISMNPGEDLKPLEKVASGGELSPLMLGLKVIFSSLQGINTVIFDEIDSGVSGPVANSIGKKMKELGKNIQVFSITHLAQVASFGTNHYHVSKSFEKDKTHTIITHLNKEERIKELAIISSGEVTENSIKAAEELFEKNQGDI